MIDVNNDIYYILDTIIVEGYSFCLSPSYYLELILYVFKKKKKLRKYRNTKIKILRIQK